MIRRSTFLLLTAITLATTPDTAAQETRAPWANLVELIEQGMASDAIPGAAVTVVQDGRVALSRGFGVENLETGRPVNPDSTLFRIGSVTKAFTGLGLLRLIAAGRADLDTPVHSLVPLPRQPPGGPVTVRHLLMHTGGFDQTGLGRQSPSREARADIAEFLDDFLVPFRPAGVVPTYDTYGMTLAGRVIEVVSGQPFADYMREEVFLPLGMERTFVEAPPPYASRLATGYGLEDGQHVEQAYEWYTTLPASSIDAPAADIARMMLVLLGDGQAEDAFLPPREHAMLMSGAFEENPPPFWFGWWVGRASVRPVLYHGGVMRGYSSDLVLLPEQRAGLFIAYNRDPETGPAPRLRERVRSAFLDQVLAGQAVESEPPPVVRLPTAAFAGWWGNTLGCFTCGEDEGWPLVAERMTAEDPGVLRFRDVRWSAVDTLTFRNEAGQTLTFIRGAAGPIRYARVGSNALERLDDDLVGRAAEIMGEEWDAGILRARIARLTERWSDALPLYRALADRYPDEQAYAFYAGVAALHLGDARGALQALDRVPAEEGRGGSVSYHRAAAMALLGRREEALDELSAAHEQGFRGARGLREDPWWGERARDPDFVGLFDPAGARRLQDMAALEAMPDETSPAGAYELAPQGFEGPLFMRAEVRRTADGYAGWFRPREGRPRRDVTRVVVGGKEVWLEIEVPGGVMDLRARIEEGVITGTLSEDGEQVPIRGRFVPGG